MDTTLVSDQYASNSTLNRDKDVKRTAPVIDTALAHVELNSLAQLSSNEHGVSLLEMPLTGLLVLRSHDSEVMQAALSSALQIELPQRLHSTQKAGLCIRWVAPDEWLLSCPIQNAFEIETAIRKAAGASSIALTNVSGGFSLLILQGDHALDVLRKSTPYDVNPDNFIAGKVVNTVFAKTQVCLRCVGDNHYEIMVRRSFADYVWHWLQVASAEYGLAIAVYDAESDQ